MRASPMTVEKWLKMPEFLWPGFCKCGTPRSVVVHGLESSKSEPYRDCVMDYCWECDVIRKRPDRHRTWYMVGEVRRPAIRDAGKPEPEDGDMVVWMRPGTTIPGRDVVTFVGEVEALFEARRLDEKGQWRLEWREGIPWAPWCPVGFYALRLRRSRPLPYRRSTLRETRFPRQCMECDLTFVPGDIAWRPYNPAPGSTVSSAGWEAMAHRDALVCEPCALGMKSDKAEREESASGLRLVTLTEPDK